MRFISERLISEYNSAFVYPIRTNTKRKPNERTRQMAHAKRRFPTQSVDWPAILSLTATDPEGGMNSLDCLKGLCQACLGPVL